MKFKIVGKDNLSNARAGILKTDHGDIETPMFMPVGTLGGVKATHIYELEEDIHAQIILSNTYHLYLRPGLDIIKGAGGIHKFNGWQKPILTDSGGYQVYSLATQRKINEEGVVFRSHIDGSKHLFTPEKVMDIQRILGADIIMAFDECTPFPCEKDYAAKSLKMTHRWLERCCKRFDTTESVYDYNQSLFPIVQGSVYTDLRKDSANYISQLEREGNAIGGLSVGEPAEMMYEMTEVVCDILPKDKPRYLMGVGYPENILESIALGIDLFDCVIPTRNARHGVLYTKEGVIHIKNKKWANDYSPIDPNGESKACRFYNKAYLRHLFASKELLAGQIASLNNLSFYLWLLKSSREKIIDGSFHEWKMAMLPVLTQRL